MGVVFELLAEVLIEIVGWIFLHLLLIPIAYVLGTPVVFVVALAGPGTYAERVRSGYSGIGRFFWRFSP